MAALISSLHVSQFNKSYSLAVKKKSHKSMVKIMKKQINVSKGKIIHLGEKESSEYCVRSVLARSSEEKNLGVLISDRVNGKA